MDVSPIQYMMKMFPELKEIDEVRKIVGRYGLTGKQQVSCNVSAIVSVV
jgi:ATP-binding cassette subfamily F protein 2